MAIRGNGKVRLLRIIGVLLLVSACGTDPSTSGSASSDASPSTSGPAMFSLQLRPVLDLQPAEEGACPEAAETPPADQETTLCQPDDGSGLRIQYRLAPARMSGDMVASVETVDSMGGVDVLVTLTDAGAARFADLTSELMALPNPQNQLAIVVGGDVQSAPVIQARIEGGQLSISGFVTAAEAQAAADSITG